MSQRDDDEDNIIIQFKPRDLPEHPDLGFEKERKSGDRSFACDHRKGTWINFEERRLTCKECGAVIDPFDKIARMVREGWSLDSRIKEIREHKAQEAEQAKRTAELKKSKVSEKISALSSGEHVLIYGFSHSQVHLIARGKFVAVDDDRLTLQFGSVAIDEIYDIRKGRA